MHKHKAPLLPSELVLNESAWMQYKEWLLAHSAKKTAVVLGKPGIGKETMVRVVNRMLNYKEELVDGTERKEEVAAKLKQIIGAQRAKTLSGRRLVCVARDIDTSTLQRIANARSRGMPVVVILEDAPKKLFEADNLEIIRCYADTHKVLQRVEKIARELHTSVPPDMKERVRCGEKIGKAVADLYVHRLGTGVRGSIQRENTRTGHLDVIRKLLHNRGGPKRKYQEIADICEKNGVDTVYDLLLENYAERCLTIEDVCTISDTTSLYETCGKSSMLYNLQNVGIFHQHFFLYNNLTSGFKIPARTRKQQSRTHMLCGNTPCRRWSVLPGIMDMAEALLIKVKQAPVPNRVDEYTKERIRAFSASVDLSSILEEEKIEMLKRVYQESLPGKDILPRYKHKDGYSSYVTRNISLSEILHGKQ
ncbi:hypothetical protein NECID01_0575 [Nematocida sp. AWRm77]|nr:hypothetical protein NECID01_0575 [Nematocida sp. AWRm77]